MNDFYFSCSSNIQIAVALSNKSSAVYNFSNNQFSCITTLKGHDKPITNVRISKKSENLVYTASLDGRIKLWDLRKENSVKELKDENGIKPLTCFDVSCDERIICAGTELVDGDAFILFWDIRSRKPLGGYWESHTDDLTQVWSQLDGVTSLLNVHRYLINNLISGSVPPRQAGIIGYGIHRRTN